LTDINFQNPILIATFDDALGVEEITFDETGNLYMIDNVNNTQIIRLSQEPLPSAVWLFAMGLFGIFARKSNRR